MKLCPLLHLLSSVLIFSSINGQSNGQLSVLRENWTNYLLMEEIVPETIEYFFTIKNDGTWSDLDYTNRQSGNWPLHDHLKRTIEMSKAYKQKGHSLYANKTLLKNIHLAYDFWVNKDMVNPNWWYAQIGIPQSLGLIMLLMQNEISQIQWQKGMAIMNRVQFGDKTGQNLVWVSANIILRSILDGDTTFVKEAADKIRNEMQMVDGKEGLQTDYSFHQHGPQLQFGNYGLHFLEDQVKWMFILKGSQFDYSAKQIELMRNYFAEGQSWVIWNKVYDINCSGRQLFPNEQLKKYKRVHKAAAEMMLIDTVHKKLYQSIISRNEIYGNKYFPKSALTIFRTKAHFCSIRMCSDKILGSESGNGENLSGYYLADGAMYIMKSGLEYYNIFPYWNWRQIPGTTTVQDTVQLPQIGWSSYHIKSDFVGGLSLNDLTVNTMQYRRDSIEAHKSYFLCPDFIVCLGSGIKGAKNHHLQTTIEQNFLYENPKILDDESIVQENSSKKGNFKHIIHGKTGYLIENADKVVISNEQRIGDWTKVLTWWPEKEKKRPIFTLGIDHGKNVSGANYAYTVFPSINETDLLKQDEKRDYLILANTKDVQAVKFNKLDQTAVIFHQAGSILLDKNTKLTSSFPGLIIIKKHKGNTSLAICDPTRNLEKGTLVLTGDIKIGSYCRIDNLSTISIDFSKNEGEPIYLFSL